MWRGRPRPQWRCFQRRLPLASALQPEQDAPALRPGRPRHSAAETSPASRRVGEAAELGGGGARGLGVEEEADAEVRQVRRLLVQHLAVEQDRQAAGVEDVAHAERVPGGRLVTEGRAEPAAEGGAARAAGEAVAGAVEVEFVAGALQVGDADARSAAGRHLRRLELDGDVEAEVAQRPHGLARDGAGAFPASMRMVRTPAATDSCPRASAWACQESASRPLSATSLAKAAASTGCCIMRVLSWS